MQIEELAEKAAKIECTECEEAEEEENVQENPAEEATETPEVTVPEVAEPEEPAAPKVLSYIALQQQCMNQEIEVSEEPTPAIPSITVTDTADIAVKGGVDGVTPAKDADESESSTAEKNTTTPLESPGTPGQGEGNSSEISSLPRSSPEASPTSSGNGISSSGASSKLSAEPQSAQKKTEKSIMGNSAKSTGSAKSADSTASSNNGKKKKLLVCTCGNFDLKVFLPKIAEAAGVELPGCLSEWCNITEVFNSVHNLEVAGRDFT